MCIRDRSCHYLTEIHCNIFSGFSGQPSNYVKFSKVIICKHLFPNESNDFLTGRASKDKNCNNRKTVEQVSYFSWVGNYITYEIDNDVAKKLYKYRCECGMLSRVLGNEVRE